MIQTTGAAFAAEIAWDRSRTTVCVAVDRDGLAVIKPLYIASADSAAEIGRLYKAQRTPRALVIDSRSTLVDPLRAQRIQVTIPTSDNHAVAVGLFKDESKAGTLWFDDGDDPDLGAALEGIHLRRFAAGELLERRGVNVDVAPAAAALFALWALRRIEPRRPPRIHVLESPTPNPTP